jgi:phosphoglycolate phosphatase
MKIPLFDIDNTLIIGQSAAYLKGWPFAFNKVFNLPNASQADVDPVGKIDNQIIIEIAEVHGLSETEVKAKLPIAVEAIFEYQKDHEIDLSHLVARGAHELLSYLRSQFTPLGILTGNLEPSAWLKLEKAGLKDYFSFGAFGDLAFKRVDLIQIAVDRYNTRFSDHKVKRDFVIIGDSPLDVKCAQDGGIQVIAVATGKSSQTDLRSAGADLVVKTLEDQTTIVNFLT